MAKNIVRLAREFTVTYNGDQVARCNNFSLSLGDNKVDVTALDSGNFDSHLRSNKSWTISFSSMVTTGSGFMDIFDLWVSDAADDPIDVTIGDAYENLQGKGTITLEMDGMTGDGISYSGTITGSGKLRKIAGGKVEYAATGDITEISPSTVIYQTNHFRVPVGVTSFSFKDDGTAKSSYYLNHDVPNTGWSVSGSSPVGTNYLLWLSGYCNDEGIGSNDFDHESTGTYEKLSRGHEGIGFNNLYIQISYAVLDAYSEKSEGTSDAADFMAYLTDNPIYLRWQFATNKTIHVSNTGNDANDGLTEGTALATVDEANGTVIEPGDSVKYERGGTWGDVPAVYIHGYQYARITIGQYGTGDKPVFSGVVDVTGWDVAGNWTETETDSNIWGIASNRDWARVWLDGTEKERADSDTQGVGLTAANPWQLKYVQGVPERLFVYSTSNPATAFTSMKITSGNKTLGTGVDYVTIRNLDIQGWERTYIDGCSNCIVEYCDIGKYSSYRGLQVRRDGTTYSNNGIIRHCTFDTAYPFFVVSPDNVAPAPADAIILNGGGFKDWDIHDNHFEKWGYITFYFTNHSENGYMTEGIKFHDNTYSGAGLNFGRAFAGHQYTAQVNEANPIEIYNNTFNDQSVYSQFGCPYLEIYNNVFNGARGKDDVVNETASALHPQGYAGRPTYKTKIYNNTIANCKYSGLFIIRDSGHDPIEGLEVVNNIFYENGEGNSWQQLRTSNFAEEGDLINPVFDNNLFYAALEVNTIRVLNSSLTASQFNDLDGNNDLQLNPSGNIAGDPLFTDAAAGVFTLAVGSPAIGAGLTPLSDKDKAGNTWSDPASMGAYEYQT